MNIFYKNLKAIAEKNGWTMNKMAEVIGVNKQTLSTWQNFEPRAEMLLRIAKIFEISPYKLLNDDDTVKVIFPKE